MISSTISHYQIMDKLGEGRSGKYLSHRRGGSFRQVVIKALPEVCVPGTEQLDHIERQAELWLLNELKRG